MPRLWVASFAASVALAHAPAAPQVAAFTTTAALAAASTTAALAAASATAALAAASTTIAQAAASTTIAQAAASATATLATASTTVAQATAPSPVAAQATASTTTAAQAATIPPPPCSSPEARAFNFWTGAWTVTDPDGKTIGENRIDSLLGGCVLLENWRDAAGREGKSWNYWHAASKTWKQHWVDGGGRVTEYTGSPTPTGMRFEAEDSGLVRVMTFTRRDDGSVEQKIEVSRDGRKTWTTGFVGIYRKR